MEVVTPDVAVPPPPPKEKDFEDQMNEKLDELLARLLAKRRVEEVNKALQVEWGDLECILGRQILLKNCLREEWEAVLKNFKNMLMPASRLCFHWRRNRALLLPERPCSAGLPRGVYPADTASQANLATRARCTSRRASRPARRSPPRRSPTPTPPGPRHPTWDCGR